MYGGGARRVCVEGVHGGVCRVVHRGGTWRSVQRGCVEDCAEGCMEGVCRGDINDPHP